MADDPKTTRPKRRTRAQTAASVEAAPRPEVHPEENGAKDSAPKDSVPIPQPPIEPASQAAEATAPKPKYWETLITPTIAGVLVAVVFGVVVGGLAGLRVLREPPVYESIAALTIDQPKEIVQAGSDGIIAKLNALRLKYQVLLKTSLFTKPVAKKLRLSESEVEQAIETNAPGSSLIVLVGARSTDQKKAKAIAEATAEQLVAFVAKEQLSAFIPPESRIRMNLVVRAPEAAKVEPTKKRALIEGGAAAGAVLVVVYLIGAFFIVRRKT